MSKSACAWATESPGLRRPRTPSQCCPRFERFFSVRTSGSQRSAERLGNRKSRGMTPMTTRRASSKRSERPTIEASPPNRLCHSDQERTATSGPPGFSSPGSNVRPRSGGTPSTGKSAGETSSARRRSGSRPSRRVASSPENAAIPERVAFCSRQSTKFRGEALNRGMPLDGLRSKTRTSSAGRA